MLYAQFYQMSTGYIPGTIPPQFGEPQLIEASGDRSVIVLDGRILESFNLNIARQECKSADMLLMLYSKAKRSPGQKELLR